MKLTANNIYGKPNKIIFICHCKPFTKIKYFLILSRNPSIVFYLCVVVKLYTRRYLRF